MLDLVERLDCHLETATVTNFTNIISDEDSFLWLPEFLHAKNAFVSLIPLVYKIKRRLGA